MDHLVDFNSADTLNFAIQRRDDSLGDGVVEAEGIADGQGLLADLKGVGSPHADGVELGGPFHQFENGNVFFGFDADYLGFVLLFVLVEGNDETAPSCDHVVVGDDVTLLVPDEAGAGPKGNFAGVKVEPTQAGADHLFAGDVDDGFDARIEDVDGIFFAWGEVLPVSCEDCH